MNAQVFGINKNYCTDGVGASATQNMFDRNQGLDSVLKWLPLKSSLLVGLYFPTYWKISGWGWGWGRCCCAEEFWLVEHRSLFISWERRTRGVLLWEKCTKWYISLKCLNMFATFVSESSWNLYFLWIKLLPIFLKSIISVIFLPLDLTVKFTGTIRGRYPKLIVSLSFLKHFCFFLMRSM